MSPKYAHRKVFDLSPLDPAKRDVVQQALNESGAPFGEIRKATDARAVVTASSLRRLEFALEGRETMAITEWRGEEPRHGIVKAEAPGVPASVSWQPTEKIPAGGIELAEHLFDEPDTARQVFITEAEALITRHVFPGEWPDPNRPEHP